MININPVELNLNFPNDSLNMVFMQPYLMVDLGGVPYRWINTAAPEQLIRITRTLEIAKTVNHEKAHFTVFPEYSIPGIAGIRMIQEVLSHQSWQAGTVVIAGVDGLSRDEYEILCSEANTEVSPANQAVNIHAGSWFNCSITWVKDNDGNLRRWLQLKLNPAWPERRATDRDMCRGSSVNLFKARFTDRSECNFLSLICFDWIGRVGDNYGIWSVLSKISNIWGQNRKRIDFAFVPQYNPEPNHNSFLENARDYFQQRTQYRFIERDSGCAIIFVNTAGGLRPGKYNQYGYSSLIFSELSPYDMKSCPPTYSLNPKKLRGTNTLDRCKDVLLREMGACIHSFRFNLPQYINLGVPDRSRPLSEAKVHQIDTNIIDPRIPGDSVPASVKWVNDQLDTINSYLFQEDIHPLKEHFDTLHQQICQEIRACADKFLREGMVKVACSYGKWLDNEKTQQNVDDWDQEERQCLETWVHSLAFIGSVVKITLKDSVWHALMIVEEKGAKRVVDIIILNGNTHQKNLEYLKKVNFQSTEERKTIIISRTSPEKPMTDKDKEIYDTDTNIYRCGFHDLISSLSASNRAELIAKIRGAIGDISG